MNAPSISGFSDPAANGMIVSGVIATEMALYIVNYHILTTVLLAEYCRCRTSQSSNGRRRAPGRAREQRLGR